MSTIVTGTLTDSFGQLWTNAPVQFIFLPTPSTPGPFIWSGGNFDRMPPVIRTDANGYFTITVPANSEITPSGSSWQVVIGPSSTYPAFVFNVYLTTGTMDVSSLFSSKAIINGVQSLFIPRAYNDNEVIIPPNSGQLYYNVTDKVFKYYESGVWATLGLPSGGGMVYPPAGIAVSTGNSWATSINPANIAYTNVANVFLTNQTINGNLSVNSISSPGNLNINSLAVFNSDIWEKNLFRIADRGAGTGFTTIPNLNSNGTDLFINAASGHNLYLNYDAGSNIIFGSGAQTNVGSISSSGNLQLNGSGTFGGLLNVGSFQIGGTAPAGQVLVGNGTTYVPQPPPAKGVLTVNTVDWSTGGRSFGSLNQNGPNLRIVSGAGHTSGGHTGSLVGLIGSGSPNIQAWGLTSGATVSNGVLAFNFTVPPNWFYQINANTRVQGGDTGVTGLDSWVETDISIV